MKDNSAIEVRGFNKIDRCVIAEWLRKINRILKDIRTGNIADINILTKAIIGYAGTKVGGKDCGSGNKKKLKPWWKRRIKKNDKSSQEICNHLRTSLEMRLKEFRKRFQELIRKYNKKTKRYNNRYRRAETANPSKNSKS